MWVYLYCSWYVNALNQAATEPTNDGPALLSPGANKRTNWEEHYHPLGHLPLHEGVPSSKLFIHSKQLWMTTHGIKWGGHCALQMWYQYIVYIYIYYVLCVYAYLEASCTAWFQQMLQATWKSIEDAFHVWFPDGFANCFTVGARICRLVLGCG